MFRTLLNTATFGVIGLALATGGGRAANAPEQADAAMTDVAAADGALVNVTAADVTVADITVADITVDVIANALAGIRKMIAGCVQEERWACRAEATLQPA